MKTFEEWLVSESTNGYIDGEEITYEDMCQNAKEYVLYFTKQEDLSRRNATELLGKLYEDLSDD